MVERSRRSAGATLAACRPHSTTAVPPTLRRHAPRARGSWRRFLHLQRRRHCRPCHAGRGRATRVAIIDCDVHQGNGTRPSCTATTAYSPSRSTVRAISPSKRESSDLDIELPDGTGDDAYLAALDSGLAVTLARSRPQLVIYLAGADPLRRRPSRAACR